MAVHSFDAAMGTFSLFCTSNFLVPRLYVASLTDMDYLHNRDIMNAEDRYAFKKRMIKVVED